MSPTERDGIDVADPWAAIEACYAQGWTDGLPVVPPTDKLVDAMLASGPWKPGDVLLHEPVRDRLQIAPAAGLWQDRCTMLGVLSSLCQGWTGSGRARP